MCGITGIYVFNQQYKKHLNCISDACNVLNKRGPDNSGAFLIDNIALGHTRLSILDTSEAANQPMTDPSGTFTIVFNGELYNYKTLKQELTKKGYKFKTTSDTEVLLNLFIEKEEGCLNDINGFFAFAVYNHKTNTLFVARDRIGIKPIYFFYNSNYFLFGSELNALEAYNHRFELDNEAIFHYLQLNYIPAPLSIYKNVKKLLPGHYIKISDNDLHVIKYYNLPQINNHHAILNFDIAKTELQKQLENSVQARLVSDVPIGAFLSGGIDSSIICGIASKYINKLNTFSIGYKDEPYFDETEYALKVAKRFNTNHYVYKLSNNDLYENLFDAINYLDEPFADSSSLAVYILSKQVKKHVTVALSGDGADELFGGYHKHMAAVKANQYQNLSWIFHLTKPMFDILPKSRNNKITNLFRQISRFGNGMALLPQQRYWNWCCINNEDDVLDLYKSNFDKTLYSKQKEDFTKHIKNGSLSENLKNDVSLILPNDMLKKVDSMSMANSLEVRVPFLDHNVVDFAFSLPESYKIHKKQKKRILQEAYRDMLPPELYNRPKHGFEVPLLKWLRNELKSEINTKLLDKALIKDQNLFNFAAIKQLEKKLNSSNPEDATAQIWGLLVFQNWWIKRH